jgi:hypothetical protein
MELYHYDESGLDYVWLENGYVVETFGDYGEGVGICDERTLWKVLGRAIVDQDRPMTGQELRYLRTMLRWSQSGLGHRLGYRDGQIVAKWEKACHGPVPLFADAIVRGLYLESLGEPPMLTETIERLRRHDGERCEPLRRVLSHDDGGLWHLTETAEAFVAA